jgi:hypothetical protein
MVELNDDEDFELDQVRGQSGKKRRLALLNYRKISKIALDELFIDEQSIFIERQDFLKGSDDILLDD